jgi:hypothetical protein
MLTLHHRLAVAGVVAVAAVAIPTAALASGSDSPSAKPATSQAPTASASKTKTGPTDLAPSAAASQKEAAKQAQSRGGGPSIASALASQLGVSASAAQHTIAQLGAMGRGGIDPTSPAFAAIAHDLGVSPARLAAALVAAKQSLAGT